MMLGKVIGTVVTTISHRDYKNRRLLVVQPLTLPGDPPDGDFIALDNSHAGIGDTVLVNREGNGARQALNNPDACVISVIVGIVELPASGRIGLVFQDKSERTLNGSILRIIESTHGIFGITGMIRFFRLSAA